MSMMSEPMFSTLSTPISDVIPSAGTELHVMIVGDSLGAGMSTGQPALDFATAFNGFGITATIYDAAQGGKRLMSDFMNPTTQEFGPEYNDEVKINNPDHELVTDMIDSLLTNDSGLVEGGVYDKSEVKTTYQNFIDLRFADPDLPNLERIFLNPIGRNTIQTSVPWNEAYQDLREIAYELAAENANVHVLSGNWSQDYADTVHLFAAGYSSVNEANAAHIAYIAGKASTPNNGMIVTSAQVVAQGIDLTISHGSGTDFTVPAGFGDGIEATKITDGASTYSFSDYERIDANTLRLHAGAPFSGTPTVTNMYGTMQALGLTSVPMVKDNSSYTLPMQEGSVVATASSDPILNLTDLKYYMNPANEKIFTTGTNFSDIRSANGGIFSIVNSDMDYDSTAFGGNGGLKFTNINGALRANDDLMSMGASDTWMYGLVFDAQGDGDIIALGSTAFGPYSQANFYMEGGALKVFRLDGSPNLKTIATGLSGTKVSLMINVRSQTECDVYVNSSTVTMTINLGNSYFFGWSTIFISAARNYQSLSNIFGLAFAKDGAHGGSDPSISILMDAMNNFKNGL